MNNSKRLLLVSRCWSLIGFCLIILLTFFFLTLTTQAKTVNVDQPEKLNETINASAGGDIIRLEGIAPFELQIKGKRFSPPIIIESSRKDSQTQLSKVEITDASGIHIRSLKISAVFPISDKSPQAIKIVKSEDISLSDCLADGGATEYLSANNKQSGQASSFALVRWSNKIVFEGNTITGFNHGIATLESTEIQIEDNVITKLQGDGIRMGGVQKIAILGNRIHDFLGSDQTVNHSDMIQLWSTHSVLVSSDITIARNRLLSGNGPATQTIFMGNEQTSREINRTDRYYRNITVTDNLIHNGHLHGITIGQTFDLTITNNTLLPNSKSTMGNGDKRKMWPPTIRVAPSSEKVVIKSNVTTRVHAPQEAQIFQNYLLSPEKFKSDAEMGRLFSSNSFDGYLPDNAYLAKINSVILNDKIGSSLTWPDDSQSISR